MSGSTLTLGILQPDVVMDVFQPEFGDYPAMVEGILADAAEADEVLDFRVFDVQHGEYPPAVDDCDAYLITGSRNSVYDDEPWIAVLEEYVRTLDRCRKPLVGICFGHQIVAKALGGETALARGGWGVGIAASEVIKPAAFMQPPLEEFGLVVSHRDQVTCLPPGATLHASSEHCPHSLFTVASHILSLQGHPEFEPGYSRALMDMRRELIGEKTWEDGVLSLDHKSHRREIARWILNFVARAPVT